MRQIRQTLIVLNHALVRIAFTIAIFVQAPTVAMVQLCVCLGRPIAGFSFLAIGRPSVLTVSIVTIYCSSQAMIHNLFIVYYIQIGVGETTVMTTSVSQGSSFSRYPCAV